MRRSTQKEVKDIQRELALAAGHQTKLIATGRLLISELYSFYSQRGYTLTPYANGQLNLTWIGRESHTLIVCLRHPVKR